MVFFCSLDGGYDGELFYGVLPRTDAFQGDLHEVTYPELAQGILDGYGWLGRVLEVSKTYYRRFTAIRGSESVWWQDVIVVSHGMTTAIFAWLINPSVEHPSLTTGFGYCCVYENGKFTLEALLGDMTYRQVGREIIEKEKCKNKRFIQVAVRRKQKPTGFWLSVVLIAVL